MINRIKEFIDNKGISVSSFEQKISASDGLIRRAIRNNTDIQSKWITKISENYHDINIEWLVTGKGSMIKSDVTAYKKDNKTIHNAIPLVSQFVAAGFASADFSIQESDVKAYYVIPKFKDRRIDFMIEVSGSSMYPKYNSGDVIACTIIKESKFIQWNKVHVIATTEQGLLVKRIKDNGNDAIVAISDNPDYPPFPIPKDEITGIALVVGVIRLE